MKKSVHVILKIISLVLLFIVTVIGCNAHFNSVWMDFWKEPGFPELCKLYSPCPSGATGMERGFAGITIFFLILSALSLVLELIMDLSPYKVFDAAFHVLAGVLIFIAGILIITAAIKLDVFSQDELNSQTFSRDLGLNLGKSLKGEIRKELKYSDKLAAGALAIINGILYFATAGAIFKS